MKIKNGVSLNSLEEILADYADLPVAQSDVTGLVSALAGKANTPIAQSDVTGLVSALASKVSNSDFQAFLDVLDAQPSVINAISYKATTIPTGTATNGELCLCDDGKIYEYTGGAWDAGEALAIGERYWHFLTGSDVSGDSGSHTPGPYFYLYEWDGEEFSTYQVTFGTFACVEDLAKFYWYNGSEVVEFSSAQLTANELLAIQNANLQGTDTVAKTSDIPAPQLSSDELTAIQNASLVNTDTIAKISDIPSPQLSLDELTAIQAANLGVGDTVAKTSDIAIGSDFSNLGVFTSSNNGATMISSSSSGFFGGTTWWNVIGYNNDYITFPNFNSIAGFYEIKAHLATGPNMAIIECYVDEVLIGSYDLYHSVGSRSIPVSFCCNLTSGSHALKFSVNGKNASSSGYGIGVCHVSIKKIETNWNFIFVPAFTDINDTRYISFLTCVVKNGLALTRYAPPGHNMVVSFYQKNLLINSEIQGPNITLPSGDYELMIHGIKNNDHGIVEVFEENTSLGSHDSYSSSLVVNYSWFYNFSLIDTKTTYIRIKVSTKNPSSQAHGYGITFFKVRKIS